MHSINHVPVGNYQLIRLVTVDERLLRQTPANPVLVC